MCVMTCRLHAVQISWMCKMGNRFSVACNYSAVLKYDASESNKLLTCMGCWISRAAMKRRGGPPGVPR